MCIKIFLFLPHGTALNLMHLPKHVPNIFPVDISCSMHTDVKYSVAAREEGFLESPFHSLAVELKIPQLSALSSL